MKLLSPPRKQSLRIWWETLTDLSGWRRAPKKLGACWGFAVVGFLLLSLCGGAIYSLVTTPLGLDTPLLVAGAIITLRLGAALWTDKPYTHPSSFAPFSATAARVMYQRQWPDEKDKILKGLLKTRPKHFSRVVEELLFDYDQQYCQLGCRLMEKAQPRQQQALDRKLIQKCMTAPKRRIREATFRTLGRNQGM